MPKTANPIPTEAEMPEVEAWHNFMNSIDEETRSHWLLVCAEMRLILKEQYPTVKIGEGMIGGAVMAMLAKGYTGKFSKKLPELFITPVPEPAQIEYPVGVEG